MILSLSTLLLLAASPARATCTLAALETRVDRTADPARLARVDRWSWRVEGGVVDCAQVDFASPSAAPITGLDVDVQRPDGRDPKPGDDRIGPVASAADPSFAPSAGLRVHLPELMAGDLLVVEVARSWPAGQALAWRPGARGALELATLDIPDDLPTTVVGGAVEDGRRRWSLASVPAEDPLSLGDGPAGSPGGPTWQARLALALPERKPLRALGDDRKSAVVAQFSQQAGAPFRVAPPLGAVDAWCEQTAARTPCADVGGVAWGIDPAQGARWGWRTPGSWPSGVVALPPGATAQAVTVDLPAGRVATTSPRPDLLTWRVVTLDGVPVLPDATAAEQLVARLAVQASIPEPGLGAALKGRKKEASAVPDVLDALRDRMHPGQLPGQPLLAPRKLSRARRSHWGTPWELAVVLTRYLQQLKLDAVPLPVRPVELGPPDPAAVAGWPAAVVRVQLPEGGVTWIDPSCGSCAPGQLRSHLDGAPALSPVVSALPPLPASTWLREVSADQVVVTIEGPLAVDLREQLLAVPAARRAAHLAATLVAPGASLLEHEGLATNTGSMRLVFGRPDGRLVPPLDVAAQAGEQVRLVRGSFIERRALLAGFASEAPIVVETEGLRWERGVVDGAWQEELVVTQVLLPRTPVEAVLARVDQSWGRGGGVAP